MNREECLKIVADARDNGIIPNLMGADLRGADLRGADLTRANLRGANLMDANLWDAALVGADLREADLARAALVGADLRNVFLERANLVDANLREADLVGADLRNAFLVGANLEGAKTNSKTIGLALALAIASHLPSDGAFVGWKKCKNGVIVKLLIPSNARRSHGSGRKCRAEFAQVLKVEGSEFGVSIYNNDFIYKRGCVVKPTNGWDENRWNECGAGIHFFITKEEAEAFTM